jgi:hypothetical protein
MRILLSMIAAASLSGCVGGISDIAQPEKGDDGNNNGDNPAGANLTAAKALFDNNVYAIVNAKCSGGGCHSETATGSTLTRFVATDKAKGWQVAVNYVALVGNFVPSVAPILQYGSSNHKGVKFEAAEVQKVTEWLTKEVELRNTTPTTPTPQAGETLSQAAERVMAAFAGCMTIANFNAANMSEAWGNLTAQNNQQCENCHSNGSDGFIAVRQPQPFFTTVQTRKMHFLQYFTVELKNGAAAAKVIPNTVSFIGVGTNQAPHLEHPTFNPTNNQGMTALNNFYNATMTAVQGGQCQPKPFTM